jgi:hypothetical protein
MLPLVGFTTKQRKHTDELLQNFGWQVAPVKKKKGSDARL